jgi:hypothetical protein
VTYAAPSDALTWNSAGERNRQLRLWRRAVSATFAEQPRCLRVAWHLDSLFNTKVGYAHPSNAYIANETGLATNKVQEALATLEKGGAVVRGTMIRPSGQKQRIIYPATALIPTPIAGVGATPTVGVGDHPHEVRAQNLRRIPRIQSSQMALAKAHNTLRDERKRQGERGPASAPDLAPGQVAAPKDAYPRSEAAGDSQRFPLADRNAGGVGIELAATVDRPSDASSGIVLTVQTIRTVGCDAPEEGKEEESEWTL